MKISLVYVQPVESISPDFFNYACRFALTLEQFKPDSDFELIVVSNGGEPSDQSKFIFSYFYNARFIVGDNVGQDVGAYLKISPELDSDLMVCFGSSSYFRMNGWLERIKESFSKYGDTLCGASGHQGTGDIHPHIRTTGFWMSPKLLSKYPKRRIETHERYEFEHGASCLTNWVKSQGKHPMVITKIGDYTLHQCDSAPGGYHSSQENLLFGDRLTEYPHGCD